MEKWTPDPKHPEVKIQTPTTKVAEVTDGRQTARVPVPNMGEAAFVVERADGQKVRTPFSGGARTG